MVKRAASSSNGEQLNNVEFQDGERTFRCEAATSPATPDTKWWWVSVTGESQRYAAFRTEPTDTQANLRERVIAYYTQLLVDRDRPREIRAHWAQRRSGQQAAVAAPSAPGVADAGDPADAADAMDALETPESVSE
jgi:hypothetical protein